MQSMPLLLDRKNGYVTLSDTRVSITTPEGGIREARADLAVPVDVWRAAVFGVPPRGRGDAYDTRGREVHFGERRFPPGSKRDLKV